MHSRHLARDILVGDVPPSLRKRRDLAPQLLKASQGKMPLKCVPDNVAAAYARLPTDSVELTPEASLNADSCGGSLRKGGLQTRRTELYEIRC
jgi:hypothetical protein